MFGDTSDTTHVFQWHYRQFRGPRKFSFDFLGSAEQKRLRTNDLNRIAAQPSLNVIGKWKKASKMFYNSREKIEDPYQGFLTDEFARGSLWL